MSRRQQAHRETFVGYIDIPREHGARDERDESFVAALFVLLLCFAALIAWLYIAAASQLPPVLA